MKLPSLLPGKLVATNLESGRWSTTTWVCSTLCTVECDFCISLQHLFMCFCGLHANDSWMHPTSLALVLTHLVPVDHKLLTSLAYWWSIWCCSLLLYLNHGTLECLLWSPYGATLWALSWGLIVVGISQSFVTKWNAKALSYNKLF
jgi:hypothetical protein